MERDADYRAGAADALAHLGEGHAVCSGAAGPVFAVDDLPEPAAARRPHGHRMLAFPVLVP